MSEKCFHGNGITDDVTEWPKILFHREEYMSRDAVNQMATLFRCMQFFI